MGAGRNPAALGLLFTWTRGTLTIYILHRWLRDLIFTKVLFDETVSYVTQPHRPPSTELTRQKKIHNTFYLHREKKDQKGGVRGDCCAASPSHDTEPHFPADSSSTAEKTTLSRSPCSSTREREVQPEPTVIKEFHHKNGAWEGAENLPSSCYINLPHFP